MATASLHGSGQVSTHANSQIAVSAHAQPGLASPSSRHSFASVQTGHLQADEPAAHLMTMFSVAVLMRLQCCCPAS